MSEVQTSDRPVRGRRSREEALAADRRQRNASTLNRMAQFRLDCIPQELLDTDNFVYRWIDDRPGRLDMATHLDDYDFVSADELGRGWSNYQTNSESDGRIRQFAEVNGSQPVYTYLCRKRKDFWEADNEEVVRRREAMMAGRVYEGEEDYEPEGQAMTYDRGSGAAKKVASPAGAKNPAGLGDNGYVPKGVKIGGPARRRSGPLNKKFR